MSLNDTVLSIVNEKGPMLPAEIVSEVAKRTGKQTDMFFIGAVLSELMSAKHVKMSYAKLGGSRLYYAKGQEHSLSRLYEYLNDKEKKAYDLLKENKVLRSSSQEPVIRVALSELKDFARPIDVNLDTLERYWYWHEVSVEDAKSIIKESLKNEIENMRKPQQDASKEEKADDFNSKKRESEREDIKSGFSDNNSSFIISSKPQNLTSHPNPASKQSQPYNSESNEKKESYEKQSEKQSKLSQGIDQDDDFMKKLISFFDSKEISVIKGSVIKKNSDSEFEVYVKSQIGKLRFYVYAKSKKKITESDLGYAFVRSQNNNLPLCFVSSGELTKKALEFLENELNSVKFLKM